MFTLLATLISTIQVTVVTMMTYSLIAVRTILYTTDPITIISTEAVEWVATNTITLTVIIRNLVDVPIDMKMAVEFMVGLVVKETATITKWIVIMELEDTVLLDEALEKVMSIVLV